MSRDDRLPPEDLEAEQAALGAMLLRPQLIDDLGHDLDPGDFHKSHHQFIYQCLLDMWATGQPIDMVTVTDALKRSGHLDAVGGSQYLLELTNATPSISSAHRYASIIIDFSRRRRAIMFWAELSGDAYQVGNDFDAVLARADASADRLIAPRSAEIRGLSRVGDFVTRAEEIDRLRPWLIPHVMKAMWRVILVAGEGIGKAVLMRFLAIHAACGLDPWQPNLTCEPVPCLYLDCENAESSIARQLRIANRQIRERSLIQTAHDLGTLHILHREEGMNLLDRRAQADFEASIQRAQAKIVFMGPLRKLFRRTRGADHEQVALEFTEYIDSLRKRYGIAVMIEHHAPKGSNGQRDMTPGGSGVFLGWPEFGLTLEPIGNIAKDATEYTLEVGRFRPDREIADWPDTIQRTSDSRLAWVPRWPKGRMNHLLDHDIAF